jgi:alpha-beta hydrolase superfamily lysophospholipase
MPFFDGSAGRIHHDAWLPDGDARSVVVLLHGYAEHLGLYDALARRLAARGHAVHAMDCVGHGRSDGERARVESWDHYVQDAHTLAGIARDRHPGRPLVLLGHSGGALAAYLLAVRHPQTASTLVLSGAPLRPVDWALAQLAGDADESEDLDPTVLLSTHPDYVHALMHDPLTYKGGFRNVTLEAVVRTWPEVATALADGRPDITVLLVHGEQDPVVPVSDARFVAAALPRAELAVFPGDLHDVLNEHDRDAVHDLVVRFLDRVQATAPIS